MFGLIGNIFGSQKALGGIVDGVTKGLDALVYTDEEKAGDAAKERSEARGMVVEWMATTKGQNIARRLIALMIVFTWLIQFWAAMLLDITVIFVNEALALQLGAAADVIGERATQMNGAMMLILGFYFAAPHMGKITEVAMQKFGSGKSNKQ